LADKQINNRKIMKHTVTEQRIVIKVGTSTLTAGKKELYLPAIVDLARQISVLLEHGKEVVLVTSGAIAAGRELMRNNVSNQQIPAKQMLAAIGQPRLMEIYAQVFRMYGISVAQVLLTRSDLVQRRGYINARNTLTALLDNKILPIVNENDAVATEEIRVGDNDNLSALVANLVEADLLILLTDQAGLYTSDPRTDASAKLITKITEPEIPEEIWQAAGGSESGLGIGGMLTKIKAADLARRSGTTVIIAKGDEKDILPRLVDHEGLGTTITPLISKVESRKRYFISGMKTSHVTIQVDAGAVQALRSGSSLLPIGVLEVKGKFDRGDIVQIVQEDEKPVAIGLVSYDSDDIKNICKHRSEEIEGIIGYNFGDEVVHRSNLVLI
jgi:glutamate 5-kinase